MNEYLFEDKEILKSLYEKNELDIYKFHCSTLLSPAQIMRSIHWLISMNIVTKNVFIITLTESGKSWIQNNIQKVLMTKSDKGFTQIPPDILLEEENKIKINEPYVPNYIDINREW